MESLGLIPWDDSGWLSHGSTLQVIKPSDSNKFYKVMKSFVYIHDPTSQVIIFWTEAFGADYLRLFSHYWNRSSQAKPTLYVIVQPNLHHKILQALCFHAHWTSAIGLWCFQGTRSLSLLLPSAPDPDFEWIGIESQLQTPHLAWRLSLATGCPQSSDLWSSFSLIFVSFSPTYFHLTSPCTTSHLFPTLHHFTL